MSIAEIVKKGKIPRPPRIVIYGDKGIGKTSFAASIDGAVFMPTEDGTDSFDVARLPKVQSFNQMLEYIGMLIKEDHNYRALVIDTVDEFEAMVNQSVLDDWKESGGKEIKSISDIPWGGGTSRAADKWRIFLKGLDVLRDRKPVAIVLICHSHVKAFKAPDAEPYDRYEMKLSRHASDLIKYWADIVGFASLNTITQTDDAGFNQKHTRALKKATRFLHVGKSPCYDSGNRYGLPDSLPLNWADLNSELLKKMKG